MFGENAAGCCDVFVTLSTAEKGIVQEHQANEANFEKE
jgi:hypothetical protein